MNEPQKLTEMEFRELYNLEVVREAWGIFREHGKLICTFDEWVTCIYAVKFQSISGGEDLFFLSGDTGTQPLVFIRTPDGKIEYDAMVCDYCFEPLLDYKKSNVVQEYKLRKPNTAESQLLIDYSIEELGADKQYAEEGVSNAFVAVFEDYTTDTPVYSGKVIVVVWVADPAYFQTFIIVENKLHEVKQLKD